ncbi:alpha/beta hydrolase family protein [Mycetocola sp. BIGb0189]|uniref:alpha/beta hydrolase family protein n=1 Tax=Mycetocola sp. BIGb0189 TaxID=2940604 RepID=UPI002166D155|nr:alpha/beta hydrolase family protein [Mycetocola sp. BIGb0189]
MGWSEADPGVRDFSGAVATGAALTRESGELQSVVSTLNAAVAETPLHWQGEGGETWAHQVQTQHDAVVEFSRIQAEMGTIISRFGSVMEDLQARANAAKARREQALATFQADAAKKRNDVSAGLLAVGSVPSVPVPGSFVSMQVAGHDAYFAAIADLQGLAQERREAERACVSGLEGVMPASWVQLRLVAGVRAGTDITSLTPAGLAQFLTGLSADEAYGLLKQMDASGVAMVWDGLSDRVKSSLVEDRSEFVGGLEGARYSDRSKANVLVLFARQEELAGEVDQARAALATMMPWDLGYTEALKRQGLALVEYQKLDALCAMFKDGKNLGLTPPRYLVNFEFKTSRYPLVAIGIGDLDQAKNVTVFVPGMDSKGSAPESEITGVLNILDKREGFAGIAYLGYESPQLDLVDPLGVVRTDYARAGGDRLFPLLAGLNAKRLDQGRVNVVAHSYGTTTAAFALAKGNVGVNSFTLLSSAGISQALDIRDLNVDPKHIYVTEPRGDSIADIGRSTGRANPEDPRWGAVAFGSDGTVINGERLERVTGHGATGNTTQFTQHPRPGTTEIDPKGSFQGTHLAQDSESMWNIQKIIVTDTPVLTPGDRGDATSGPIRTWWDQINRQQKAAEHGH